MLAGCGIYGNCTIFATFLYIWKSFPNKSLFNKKGGVIALDQWFRFSDGFAKHWWWDPTASFAVSEGLGWSLRICFFNKFPDDADATVQGPRAENHWSRLCQVFLNMKTAPSLPMEKKGPRAESQEICIGLFTIHPFTMRHWTGPSLGLFP